MSRLTNFFDIFFKFFQSYCLITPLFWDSYFFWVCANLRCVAYKLHRWNNAIHLQAHSVFAFVFHYVWNDLHCQTYLVGCDKNGRECERSGYSLCRSCLQENFVQMADCSVVSLRRRHVQRCRRRWQHGCISRWNRGWWRRWSRHVWNTLNTSVAFLTGLPTYINKTVYKYKPVFNGIFINSAAKSQCISFLA